MSNQATTGISGLRGDGISGQCHTPQRQGPAITSRTPSRLVVFRVQGSNGYRLQVISIDRRHLFVSATRLRGAAVQAAGYVVPQRAHGARIRSGPPSAGLGASPSDSARTGHLGPRPEPGQSLPRRRNPTQQRERLPSAPSGFTANGGFTDRSGRQRPAEYVRLRAGLPAGSRTRSGSANRSRRASVLTRTRAVRTELSVQRIRDHVRRGFSGRASTVTRRRSRRLGQIGDRPARATCSRRTLNVHGQCPEPCARRPPSKPPLPFTGTATFERRTGANPVWSGIAQSGAAGRGERATDRLPRGLCRICLAGASGAADALKTSSEPASAPAVSATDDGGCSTAAQGSGSQSQAFWDARLSWSR